MVLVTGSELIDDVRKAPDDVLSNAPASEVRQRANGEFILIWIIQVLQTKYTMSLLNPNDEYHTDIVRSQLTRNIAATFKEVREELIMGMNDLIPTHEDGAW
jgi:hypothetical protein